MFVFAFVLFDVEGTELLNRPPQVPPKARSFHGEWKKHEMKVENK